MDPQPESRVEFTKRQRDSRIGFLFLLLLLLVSSGTASYIGYQIKIRDAEIHQSLIDAYQKISGRKDGETREAGIFANDSYSELTPKEKTFVLAYECNVWLRAFGVDEFKKHGSESTLERCSQLFNEVEATSAQEAIAKNVEDGNPSAYSNKIFKQSEIALQKFLGIGDSAN